MKSSKKIIFYSIFLTLLSFSISYWYFEHHLHSESAYSKKEALARVVRTTNISRKKPELHRYWKNIDDGDILYDGETIKTADDSSVEIEFLNQQGKLILDPETLIQLKKKSDGFALELFTGGLSANSSTPVEIQTPDQEESIQLTGVAQVAKKVNQNNLQVASLDDKTLVQKKQKKIQLKKNQTLNSKPVAKTNPPLVIQKKKYLHQYLKSIDKEIVTSQNQTHHVQKRELVTQKVFVPQVSPNSLNSSSSAQTPLAPPTETPTTIVKPSEPVSLTPVEPLQTKEVPEESKTTKIQKAPATRRPAAVMKSETMKASADGSLYLEWLKDSEIREYQLSLRGPKNQLIKSWKQKNNFTTLKNLRPGNYKITVRGQDKKGLMNTADSTQTFEIPSESNIQAPKLKGIKIK